MDYRDQIISKCSNQNQKMGKKCYLAAQFSVRDSIQNDIGQIMENDDVCSKLNFVCAGGVVD